MNVQGRESFQFNLGDNIHVLSDKAFRKSKENKFEAVGNVVITHQKNAIYGEKATLSFNSGETKVIGNVRYVSPTMTMYGAQLDYNINTNYVHIQNARVLADNYVVLGKEITRSKENVITAVDAEYTTCRDCPESWSIFGKRVRITVGEYIRIWHAYIRVKGVVIMYIPYIILPIKKDRETGLLFPSFSYQLEEGMRFYLPWFWAISPSSDLTVSPAAWGKRGLGSLLQYRQALGERKWFEVNSLLSNDSVYQENKPGYEPSGSQTFRHLSEWEHHFEIGNSFNHHFSFSKATDMDMIRDFDFYSYDRLFGSELGGGGYFNFNTKLFDYNLESYFVQNQLNARAKEFDDDYVQILPKLNIEMAPIEVLNSKYSGIRRLSLGADMDVTVFKQNKVNEGSYIRNATRLNGKPYLTWNLGNFGPVHAKTTTEYDFQYYHFPNEKSESFLRKSAFIQESELSLEFEKIFGLSYSESVPAKEVKVMTTTKEQEKREVEEKKNHEKFYEKSSIIGVLPRFDKKYSTDEIFITRSSYKHSQEFKLKHYLLSNEKVNGSSKFKNQIEVEEGQFDTLDGLRERQHTLNKERSRTTLPLSNTIEFQWNNHVIKKTTNKTNIFQDHQYLRDNFYYSKIFYFNVSQGFDLDVETDLLKEKLTRLHVETGYNFGRWSLSASEYFFYGTGEHLIYLNSAYQFDTASIFTVLNYNSFTKPVDKRIDIGGDLKLTDLLSFSASYSYDIEDERETASKFAVLYSPYNDCWKLGVDYSRSLVEKRIGLNFLINFNENSFKSLTDF